MLHSLLVPCKLKYIANFSHLYDRGGSLEENEPYFVSIGHAVQTLSQTLTWKMTILLSFGGVDTVQVLAYLG